MKLSIEEHKMFTRYFVLLDERRDWTKRSIWPKAIELAHTESFLRIALAHAVITNDVSWEST